MSRIQLQENLFLGLQELNRILKFIQVDGIKQRFLFNTATFGLLPGYKLPNNNIVEKADVFRVNNDGISVNYKVNVNPGRAIDKYGNILTLDEQKTVEIPNNGQWYSIIISHRYRLIEEGIVNISKNGELTGDGTQFLDVLRGQPNFPVLIKFKNSQNNGTYEVVSVQDDENAILAGEFIEEQDIQYQVVGTYTPGVLPTAQAIYNYDSVSILVIKTDDVSTVHPIRTNRDFLIAKVRTVGQNVEIKDERTEFWTTNAESLLDLLHNQNNHLIGVESVKWDVSTTPRDKNEINIAWAYRSSNWSLDTTQNIVTISSGQGGIFKENDLSLFTNGQFDGWRLYVKSGEYFTIISSTKSGSQLNLKLDTLISEKFVSGSELLLTPNVDEVQIKLNYDNAAGINLKLTEVFSFPVNLPIAKIYARIVDSNNPYKYNLTYRYKTLSGYTDWLKFNDDEVGYYSENSFDENGVIHSNAVDREQKPYTASLTDGFIELVPNPRNYNILFQEIITGDKFGVDHKDITNATPVTQLVVGADRQMQVLHFNSVVLSNDIFINLNKTRDNGTQCINGNKFIIQIQGDIDLNGRNLRIVTDYVDPTNYTLVRDITQRDITFIKNHKRKQNSGLTMIFAYDGSEWWLAISNEFGVPANSIIAYSGDLNEFDSSGLGTTPNTLGWAICNGNNGTVNLQGRVIVGVDPNDTDHNTIAGIGGSKTKVIERQHLPDYELPQTQQPHTHRTKDTYINYWNGGGPSQVWGGGHSRDYTTHWRVSDDGIAHIQTRLGGQGVPFDMRQPYTNLIYIQKII